MSEKILVDTEIREQEVNFIFIYSIKLILKLHLDIGGNKHRTYLTLRGYIWQALLLNFLGFQKLSLALEGSYTQTNF